MSAALILSLLLASSIIHTFFYFDWKRAIKAGADPNIFFWLSGIFSVLISTIIYFIFFSEEKISSYILILAFITGAGFALQAFFTSKAFVKGDFSLVYPLTRLTPLFTLFIGLIFLKEVLTITSILGILLIVIGIYTIHIKDIKNIFAPLLHIREMPSIFALLAAFVATFYSLSTKLASASINPFVFVYFSYIFMVICWLPLLLLRKNSILSQLKKFPKPILRICLLDVASYSLVTAALALGTLSEVIALRQMGILFSSFVGIYIFRESYGKFRIASSIFIFIGLVLIALSL